MNQGDSGGIAQMDVSCLPAHRVEQASLVALLRKREKFYPGAIWGETAHDPVLVIVNAGVVDPDSLTQKARAEDFGGCLVARDPDASGGPQSLCLARDKAAAPFRQRHDSWMSQAAQASDSPAQRVRHSFFRQRFLQESAGMPGDFEVDLWQAFHPGPEMNRVAQLV